MIFFSFGRRKRRQNPTLQLQTQTLLIKGWPLSLANLGVCHCICPSAALAGLQFELRVLPARELFCITAGHFRVEVYLDHANV